MSSALASHSVYSNDDGQGLDDIKGSISNITQNSNTKNNSSANINLSQGSEYAGVRFPVSIDDLESWGISFNQNSNNQRALDSGLNKNGETEWTFSDPFAPFARAEKLGRIIADFTGGSEVSSSAAGDSHRRFNQNYHQRVVTTRPEEEEGLWSLTSERTNAVHGGSGVRKTLKTSHVAPRVEANRTGKRTPGGGFGNRKIGSAAGWGQRFSDRQAQRKRETSIAISSSWIVVEEIEFSRLAKLQLDHGDPILLDAQKSSLSNVPTYDRAFDKISTKSEKIIKPEELGTDSDQTFSAKIGLHSIPSLEDDKVLLKLVKEHGASIACSDASVAALMAAPRSILPWDIYLKRLSNPDLLIIDHRQDCTVVGGVTVNETISDSMTEEQIRSLSVEATKLRNLFPSLLTKKCGSNDNRAADSSVVGVRYTKIELGENCILIVRNIVRTTVLLPDGDISPLPIIPLLELSGEKKPFSGLDWKSKLDTQRGAILANEIKNNSFQLAKTVFSAILSSSSLIKLAYVNKTKGRLSLLGLQEYEPFDLASQMNLNIPNGFGILVAIVDLVRKLPDAGDYYLIRDPNRAILRLYKTKLDEMDSAINDLIKPISKLSFDRDDVDGNSINSNDEIDDL